MNNNFQRLFYILKNMDNDFGYPTGYIRVEINCEMAKIQISLSNLLNRQGMIYQLYGISKVDNDLSYTIICDIPNINGRADVKINVDSLKIGTNKLRLDDINIFAIIPSHMPNKITSIKCPLVAYKKDEIEWKKQLETLLLNKKTNIEEIPAVHLKTVLFDDIKSEVEALEEMKDSQVVLEDVQKEEVEDLQNVKAEVLEEMQDNEAEVLEDMENDETNVSEYIRNIDAEIDIEDSQTEEVGGLEKQYYLEQTDNHENVSTPNVIEPSDDNKLGFGSKFEAELTGIYNREKPTESEQESNEFTFAENDILSSARKNFKDISSIDIDGDKRKNELNVLSLKAELDKSFESYNPFKMKDKNFKWWKINSPGFLNNILFRNNVKTYLLFNPKVMLAHYKYRYIIFGIRNDKHSGKEYFMCGVPGVYSIDENPFGNMGSWAQLEGYKAKYGAFGYWIILIDPRTGKLLKIK